ncbi:MAG: hypothetical protein VX730_01625 [Pseudomonadota bacterium]|nr:hypothetical protein [Pseudomonadota bacterium]
MAQNNGILWAVPTELFPASCRLHGGNIKERCHHITLGMGPLTPLWERALGMEFVAQIVEDTWSDSIGVQAYEVKVPDRILRFVKRTSEVQQLGNPPLHLTLFTKEGVGAFKSNVMLAGRHNRALAPLRILSMRVAYCPESEMDNQPSFRQV